MKKWCSICGRPTGCGGSGFRPRGSCFSRISFIWAGLSSGPKHGTLCRSIEGRSSIGRLGLFVHVTAGFGDVGFCGFWTLEMFAVQPVRIYAGVAICQIFYHDIHGSYTEYASDKYQNNTDIQPSLLFKELDPECIHDPQLKLPFGIERSRG